MSRHPYTRALLSALPEPDPDAADRRSGSCSPATCPRPPIPRAAAASTPAARRRAATASPTTRCWCRSSPTARHTGRRACTRSTPGTTCPRSPPRSRTRRSPRTSARLPPREARHDPVTGGPRHVGRRDRPPGTSPGHRGSQSLGARVAAPAPRPGGHDLPAGHRPDHADGGVRAPGRGPDRSPAEQAVPRDRPVRRGTAGVTQRRVLARHRLPGPRHPGADRLRRPDLAAGRRARHRHHRRHRRGGRPRGRLPRRSGGHPARPVDRPRPLRAVPARRRCPRLDLRGRAAQRGAGHRVLQLGVGRPHRAGSGPVAPGEGVRRGGALAGRTQRADHVRRHPPQRDGPGHRLHHPADPGRDRGRGDPLVPRAWGSPRRRPTGAAC